MLHRRALSNDVGGMGNFGDRLFQPRILLLGAAMRHGLGHQVRDLVRVKWLIDVVIGAVLERRNGRFHRGITRHDDDQHVRIDLVQPPLQFDAVGAAHLDVHQRDIEGLLGYARQRLIGVLRGGHFIALLSEPLGQRVTHAELIIHDQQFALRHSSTSFPPLRGHDRQPRRDSGYPPAAQFGMWFLAPRRSSLRSARHGVPRCSC